MGMFDDLIPGKGGAPKMAPPSDVPDQYMAESKATAGAGMFADLVPAAKPLDFSQPPEEIRRRIGLLGDEKARDKAHQDWADYRVAQLAKKVGTPRPDVARGIPIIGRLTDEMVGAADAGLYAISGGRVGQPYEEGVAEERARARAARKEYPVFTAVGELAAGIATGGPFFSRFMTAPTVAGQAMQSGALAGAIGAAEGLASEGDLDERLQRAAKEGTYGAAIGALAPPVLSGVGTAVEKASAAASPLFARFGAKAREVQDRLAIKASADGGGGPMVSPGADAAAEQIIANQLVKAGVPMSEVRRRLDAIDDAVRFDANSRAQNATALVDVDPSLQRLAGSVGRQQPEADNLAKSFQFSRQSGLPSGTGLPDDVMIPTRPLLAKPQDGDLPMGQSERLLDALKRAFQLKDYAQHGHGKTGYLTEKLVTRRMKAEADELYGQARKLAEGYDLRSKLQPIIDDVLAQAADEPQAVGHAIRTFVRQFTTKAGEPVSDLNRFQKAKEFGDGLIQKWMTAPEGRNRYVGGRLDQIQKQFLKAVDDIQDNGIGAAYQAARNAYASERELLDAYTLGKEFWKEEADVAVDVFRALATEGERKMARLGFWEGAKQKMAVKGRTHDSTQMFQTPRSQEVLEALIPRSRTEGAVFANRPERFGEYLTAEQKMIQTRNQTLGGSPTQQRIADDAALDDMQSFLEAAKRGAQTSGSITGFVLNVLETALSKAFGFRADTAAAIARMLYSANPQERARLLARIEMRMEPGRAAQFARIVNEISRAGAGQPIASGSSRAQGDQ